MTDGVFLWPQSANIHPLDLAVFDCPSAKIEDQLHAFYGTDAVLFSSARAGLTAVLEVMGLSRPDLVWVPSFSSHCVLASVAHFATPTTIMDPQLSAALIYHQWGHVNQPKFASTVAIIEDAVDSLFLPGRSPFSTDSRYVLWSLPKALATLGGGVVFCRYDADGSALRVARDRRRASYLQAWLRWQGKRSKTSSAYWNGAEAQQGALVQPLRRQVSRRLTTLEEIVDARLRLLRSISRELTLAFERSGRLPSNLPVRTPLNWMNVWGEGKMLTAGLRYFNRNRICPDSDWLKVAPLPVHLDVSRDLLDVLLAKLDTKGDYLELSFV